MLITLMAITLAACSSQPIWNKDGGASQTEFEMAQGQCRAQGFQIPGVYVMQAVAVFTACMQGKGFFRVNAQGERL